jgi:hypothetical protein
MCSAACLQCVIGLHIRVLTTRCAVVFKWMLDRPQQQQQRRQYPQQQQQQQFHSQQSHGSERTGIRVLELPTQTQPFPVHFEREQNAQKRARQ